MKTTLALALTLLTAAPILAADAPTTQPTETPTTQPAAATQPGSKPKARLNDAPPRKNVPIIIKEAKDVWKLLPEELRPGKDGKVSDELAAKIEAWAKKGEFGGVIVQFSTFDAERVEGINGWNAVLKRTTGNLAVKLMVPVRDLDDIKKANAIQFDPEYQRPLLEFSGKIDAFKFSRTEESTSLSFVSNHAHIVKVTVIRREDR